MAHHRLIDRRFRVLLKSQRNTPHTMFKIICKTCTLILIASLVWTNDDARNFIADGFESAEEFVRPEPKSFNDRVNNFFN